MGMFHLPFHPRRVKLITLSQDATLAHYAGYTEEGLQPCFLLMVDYLTGPVKHDAFFKKYAHKKFLRGKYTVLFRLRISFSNQLQHP